MTQRPSDVVKQQIIDSLFNGFETGATDTYIAHIKVLEDELPGERDPVLSPANAENQNRKQRYLILSFRRNGRVRLHKAKKVRDGHFSIGRTWLLEELKGIEVVNPSCFMMTLNRSHAWYSDKPKEQVMFLNAVCKVYKKYTNGNLPDLVNFVPSVSRKDNDRSKPSAVLDHRGRSTSDSSERQNASPRATVTNTTNINDTKKDYLESRQYEYNRDLPNSPSTLTVDSIMTTPTSPSLMREIRPRDRFPEENSSRTQSVTDSLDSRGLVNSGKNTPTTPHEMSRQSSRSESTFRTASPGIKNDNMVETQPNLSSFDKRTPAGRVRAEEASIRTSSPAGSIAISFATAATTVDSSGAPSEANSETSRGPDSRPGSSSSRFTSRRKRITAPTTQAEQEELSFMNVEEFLQDYDWDGSGNADKLEERLLDELNALEAANIHAIIESDERVVSVIDQLEKAIKELDSMDSMLAIYSAELSSMGDDISHIESQNRGLQVQTANQKALLQEVERLLQAINVPEKELIALKQEPLQSGKGIARLEEAAGYLYLALQNSLDDTTSPQPMMAVRDRIDMYKGHSEGFCRRIMQHLGVMIQFTLDEIVQDRNRVLSTKNPKLYPLDKLCEFLNQYSAFILYMKELDSLSYDDVVRAYIGPVGDIYKKEIQEFLGIIKNMVRKPIPEDPDAIITTSFFQSQTPRSGGTIRRVGTSIRSPNEREIANQAGKLLGSDAFARALQSIIPQIIVESNFCRDFFHLNSTHSSYAEFIGLEGQTSIVNERSSKHDESTQRSLLLNILSEIFMFLPDELRSWIEGITRMDPIQTVGIIAKIEEQLEIYGESSSSDQEFLIKFLQKQHQRLSGSLERFVQEQIKAIDETKVTSRKRGIVRRGVVPFIRVFPAFVERVEPQLSGISETLDIRDTINEAYERIVQAMFDSLQAMAAFVPDTPNTQADEKEHINYHVMMLENMHHFHKDLSHHDISILEPYMHQAKEKYENNLNEYVRAVVRRPWGKLLDFFEGVETLIKTTAPEEIGFHISYNKVALKKAISSIDSKDLKKGISTLYKRVDKHFTEEEGLLGAVWNAVEAGMLSDYQRFVDLIQSCYPNSGIELEFTMDDISSAFRKGGS